MSKIRVIDFFCGCGGFSEGFKQMGYQIVYGFDHWKPAIETFNFNFNLNCKSKNILDFNKSLIEIDSIPNTEIIIGSPPCVSFSSSNKSGKADKSLGIELTETFFRIIAVKKHQPNSILKAWLMENVPNSKKYLKSKYTFSDLNLSDFAIKLDLCPNDIAISLAGNSEIINSADYGSFQIRKRLFSGELINERKLSVPDKTHCEYGLKGKKKYRTLKNLKDKFINPYSNIWNKIVFDPEYPKSLSADNLTDHFYDTGIYKSEWRFSKYLKTNHPYMGKMSFPENEDKPSRTITATKIANSRESLIYKSEIDRKGDGEYRIPTVREAAIIMGFPITYQFLGSENTKWRLIGNAVCCSVSRAFAKHILKKLNYNIPSILNVNEFSFDNNSINLNTFKLKVFNNPPKKIKGARFRRHLFKDGNLTVTLSNYDIHKKSKSSGKWVTTVQYGTGKRFTFQSIKENFYIDLEKKIEKLEGKNFIDHLEQNFFSRVGNSLLLQKMYESQVNIKNYLEPTELFNELELIFEKFNIKNDLISQEEPRIFTFKKNIPRNQFFALYALNKICSIANNF